MPTTFELGRSHIVTYRSLAELKPDPRNPRAHGKRHIRQLAKSMEAFGFTNPILVDGDGQVIAGHGRLEAARVLEMDEVPTICLADLSETQRLAYMVADNRLGDLSNWKQPLLRDLMLELAEADLSFDLDAAGFSVAEIDLMFVDEDDRDSGDDALPEGGPAVAQLGDVWEAGTHLIFCGSALERSSFQQIMTRRKADLVVTDPPYNVPIAGHVSGLGKVQHREFAQGVGEMSEAGFIAFLETSMRHCAESSREGSLHNWAMDWRHLHELTVAARAVYAEQINLGVWVKTNAGMGSFYRSQHELFGIWRHGTVRHTNNVELGRFGRSRTNVWTYPGANSFGRASEEGNLLALHPTVKPVALLADIILDSTRRGEIVLDPFLGSGSTMIAAEKIGRQCRGIELDPLYVDVIIRRWQRWSGGQARRVADGAPFDELSAAALAAA